MGRHAAAGRAIPGPAPAHKETAFMAPATSHGLHHRELADLCSGQLACIVHSLHDSDTSKLHTARGLPSPAVPPKGRLGRAA